GACTSPPAAPAGHRPGSAAPRAPRPKPSPGCSDRGSAWPGDQPCGQASGRPAAGQPAGPSGSPAPVDPLLEVGPLRADGGVEAVAGQDLGVGGEGEQLLVGRPEDGGEVAAFERGGAGAAREQRVATEQDG